MRGTRHLVFAPNTLQEFNPAASAYLTDVGMPGPHDGVIGVEKALPWRRTATLGAAAGASLTWRAFAERQASEDRLRQFLADASHELRTPLSSIRALAQLLLDRMDGELSVEQERQIMFIASAANDLSTLVNDLLDLAKIEAGKVQISVAPIDIAIIEAIAIASRRRTGSRPRRSSTSTLRIVVSTERPLMRSSYDGTVRASMPDRAQISATAGALSLVTAKSGRTSHLAPTS